MTAEDSFEKKTADRLVSRSAYSPPVVVDEIVHLPPGRKPR